MSLRLNSVKLVAIIAAVTIILLVTSIATTGVAPFSYQQQPASDRQGPRIASANIVDGEVRNQDLAPDAVTSDKIKNGEVKAEDLDPSIEIDGGGGSGFSLQVTERSSTTHFPEGLAHTSGSVQCNSDEVVTGGGYAIIEGYGTLPEVSKKQDNGWFVRFANGAPPEITLTVYAECLKIVNEEGTTGRLTHAASTSLSQSHSNADRITH